MQISEKIYAFTDIKTSESDERTESSGFCKCII